MIDYEQLLPFLRCVQINRDAFFKKINKIKQAWITLARLATWAGKDLYKKKKEGIGGLNRWRCRRGVSLFVGREREYLAAFTNFLFTAVTYFTECHFCPVLESMSVKVGGAFPKYIIEEK